MRFLGFIRRPNLLVAKSAFPNENDVAFHAVEDATFAWEYWDSRMKNGLPR